MSAKHPIDAGQELAAEGRWKEALEALGRADLAAKYGLLAGYARATGGLTLRYWELRYGFLFENPAELTSDLIAEELGVPLADLLEIRRDTWTWVDAQYAAGRR
jgi:hypothetical protein